MDDRAAPMTMADLANSLLVDVKALSNALQPHSKSLYEVLARPCRITISFSTSCSWAETRI